MDKSQQLQSKLYFAAKKCRKRKFHALYDRICRPDILWRAWCEVRSKGGRGGIDGLSFKDIKELGVEEYLEEIRTELEEKNYKPSPVLRALIPKPGGGKRPLGIPVIKDRIVQQACKIVIEPIFEANFLPDSYGYRSKKSAGQAVKRVGKLLTHNWWVIDLDIKGYFDSIDHDILMSLVKRRISDRRVLKLIRLWLKAGVMVNGKYFSTEKGSPQGGVISPLLANIYLHVFDMHWNTMHKELGSLIRYADDCVILTYRKAEMRKAYQVIVRFLSKLKLELNKEKTKIVDTNYAGFKFLSFYFRRCKSNVSGKIYPFYWPRSQVQNFAFSMQDFSCYTVIGML